ncbi:MAG: LysM peptidoglycan-binding domain-containing protein [Actinobacteria bacterium]|nr:LysM peptidoglycan-binding domain-containing protein [Actinomycetota bacterium]
MFVRSIALALVFLVGWVVFARPSSGSPPSGSYVVRPHDTLWSIASRYYGGDPREGVWKISERNHLSGTVIRVGERLVMP